MYKRPLTVGILNNMESRRKPLKRATISGSVASPESITLPGSAARSDLRQAASSTSGKRLLRSSDWQGINSKTSFRIACRSIHFIHPRHKLHESSYISMMRSIMVVLRENPLPVTQIPPGAFPNFCKFVFCPVGTDGNSPPIYRWDCMPGLLVP